MKLPERLRADEVVPNLDKASHVGQRALPELSRCVRKVSAAKVEKPRPKGHQFSVLERIGLWVYARYSLFMCCTSPHRLRIMGDHQGNRKRDSNPAHWPRAASSCAPAPPPSQSSLRVGQRPAKRISRQDLQEFRLWSWRVWKVKCPSST